MNVKLLWLVAVGIGVVGAIVACQPLVAEFEEILIPAQDYTAIRIKLKAGDLLEGRFRIMDDPTEVIGFAIKTPEGRFVSNWTYAPSGAFRYQAQTDGFHFLYFDNTHSSRDRKVSVSHVHPRR